MRTVLKIPSLLFIGAAFTLLSALSAVAFTTPPTFSRSRAAPSSIKAGENGDKLSPVESFLEDVKMRYRIYQSSTAEGASFKQALANVIAGDYDYETVRTKVEELAKSAPCVMFVWINSPSCKQAISALDKAGADYDLVRLDDPWDEGNKMRAELGKMTGKASVPSVWIGGEYIGGFDAGVSDDRPGLVDMAFMGTLRPKLEAAGALKSSDPVSA